MAIGVVALAMGVGITTCVGLGDTTTGVDSVSEQPTRTAMDTIPMSKYRCNTTLYPILINPPYPSSFNAGITSVPHNSIDRITSLCGIGPSCP